MMDGNQEKAPISRQGVRRLRYFSLLLALTALFTGAGHAQRVYPLDTVRQSITFQVDMAAGVLLQLAGPAEGGDRLSLQTPQIEGGDLLLPYTLMPAPGKGEYYDLSLAIRRNGRAFPPAPENLSGTGKVTNPSGSIRWLNILESYINVADTLEFIVTGIHFGLPSAVVDCANVPCEKPVLNARPFVIAGAAGAGLIGLGQIFRSRSRDIYDKQYAPAKGSEAEQYYDKANGKHHTYLLLTYAGAAVLAADAVWWLIRELETGRKRRLYEQCCTERTLGFRPAVDLPAAGGAPFVGVQLRLNFPSN